MKHKIIKTIGLSIPYEIIRVELMPETQAEAEAIIQVEKMEANEYQKELIENYLHFGLNNSYSVLSIERQKGNFFELRVANIN